MIEFELKFQIPARRRSAVLALVAGRKHKSEPPIHLQAAYFDTSDRLLAKSALALRIRREGEHWVQTLKGAASDGLAREEHNLPLGAAHADSTPPAVDPQRHRGVPAGNRLLDLLGDQAGRGLSCSYRSDIWRLRRQLRTRFGSVELAFDEGFLSSGKRRIEICELEIELLDGHPLAVIDAARRWALRSGLWLDIRSKAERGDLLARELSVSPANSDISPSTLHEQHSPRAALQASIAAVRNPVLANASQIASGVFEPEHVHQLRVMLRRLRVNLRLFSDDAAAAALGQPLVGPAADLFGGLGAGRDRSVLAGQISADIEAALRQAGDAGGLPLPIPDGADAGMVDLVRGSASQHFLLALIEATLPAVVDVHSDGDGGVSLAAIAHHRARPAKPARLRSMLRRRLDRWQRSISRDAGKFAELDDTARHQLRKHVKRLRYAIDAAHDLLDKRMAKALVKPLKKAQQVLGDMNDLSTAIGAFDTANADHRAWFARGWLIARQQALVDEGAKPMKQLSRALRKTKLR